MSKEELVAILEKYSKRDEAKWNHGLVRAVQLNPIPLVSSFSLLGVSEEH
jgi:hypothetical protein